MEKQPSYFQRDMGASQLVDPVPHEPELLVEPLVPNGKELYYVQLADVALQDLKENHATGPKHGVEQRRRFRNGVHKRDRKSTRLNSSHANISYAVFCLKKKKKRYT